MPAEFTFTCALEHGLHARPASLMRAAVLPFESKVTMTRSATGQSADVRSVLSLVALDVIQGDECVIKADGPDEAEVITELTDLVNRELAEIESAVLEQEQQAQGASAAMPAGVQRLGVRCIRGRGVSAGFGHAPALIIGTLDMPRFIPPTRGPEREQSAAHKAIDHVRNDLAIRFGKAEDGLERDLLRAHLGIADDPALRAAIDDLIRSGRPAIAAVAQAAEQFMAALRAAKSAYIRDRAVDVEDVCQQILEYLGVGESTAKIDLRRPSIIVADLLTPRQMMQMDRQQVRGLVLGRVGATSHTAILARAFGIPTVVDVPNVHSAFVEGADVIVDAERGFVLPEVTDEVRRYYAIGQRAGKRRRERLLPHVNTAATTRDGMRLEVAANVSSAEEVKSVISDGAEGIGLFRTEMLFLDRPAAPDETEQYEAFAKAVRDADGRTVIFRTFDIGGDKPAPYLRLPQEDNPFLGWRGIRLYERFAELFRTHLRAILRTSALGPIKVMAPMVSNLNETTWFVEQVRQTRQQLQNEGAAIAADIPLGVMIEVPSATTIIDQLSGVVDFFSIGTNDLAQYFMAADRANPKVTALCDPLEPAFLRVLKSIVEAAKQHKKWIGICGELAGEILHLPLMVGLGVDEISVSSGGGGVLELKAALAGLDCRTCGSLVERMLAARNAAEVRAILSGCSSSLGSLPIIDADLVVVETDARTKIEVIRELVCALAAAGRTGDADVVENAIWAREETYSTGLGFGFAIPHCKSNAMRTPTIAVLKAKEPIDWGSTDGEPVRIAMMLAIPAGGSDPESDEVSKQAARMHMQILARLSRKLMHDGFREQLLAAHSPQQVVDAVLQSVAD